MISITTPSNTAESLEAKSELLYKDIIKWDLNLMDPQYNVIYYKIETKIRERNLLRQPLRIILKKEQIRHISAKISKIFPSIFINIADDYFYPTLQP